MKFLVDNQLPPALARFIDTDLGCEAKHVADCGSPGMHRTPRFCGTLQRTTSCWYRRMKISRTCRYEAPTLASFGCWSAIVDVSLSLISSADFGPACWSDSARVTASSIFAERINPGKSASIPRPLRDHLDGSAQVVDVRSPAERKATLLHSPIRYPARPQRLTSQGPLTSAQPIQNSRPPIDTRRRFMYF